MTVNLILRLEAAAFTGFGLVFFFIPELWNDGIFGWEGTTILFARIIGAAYLGLAVLAWKLVAMGDVDATLVWGFALVPVAVLAAMIWDKAADTYTGPDSWLWLHGGLIVAYTILGVWAGISASRQAS